MKKLLLSFVMLTSTIVAWANRWDAPNTYDFKDRMVVYLQLKVNGTISTPNDQVELAAFLNGECRGDVDGMSAGSGFYALQVYGATEENGADVSFKVLYNGLAYYFKQTIPFAFQTTYESVPLTLNLDAITGVSITNPLEITQKVGTTYDLSNDITFTYSKNDGTAYTCLGESALDEELFYEWDFAYSADFFDVKYKTLHINQATGNDARYLGLNVHGSERAMTYDGFLFSVGTSTMVTITEPQVSVESISISPDAFTLNIGENAYDVLWGTNTVVTILPAEADQSFYFEPAQDAEEAFMKGIAQKAGTYTWYVISNSDETKKAAITITVTTPVSFDVPQTAEATLLTDSSISIQNLQGDGFNPGLVTVDLTEETMAEASISQDGKTITFKGFIPGTTGYVVNYNGTPMGRGTLSIKGEVQLANGWNWTTFYMPFVLQDEAGGYKASLFSGDNKILEARSQFDLLYNDSKVGVFGTIQNFDNATMYKVKASCTNKIRCILDAMPPKQVPVSVEAKGYTWIVYPIIGDHTFEYFNSNGLLATASEGDVIIGKDGFAEFNGGEWMASEGFMLKTGQGYIYYQAEAGAKRLIFGENYVREALPKAMPGTKSVWKYDISQHPDNMAMVAEIEGLENPEAYSIGAFVNGECRGEGSFVGGKAMIHIAGSAGETVILRLYNTETGEYTDINASFRYTQKMGSLQEPKKFSNDITGIHSTEVEETEDDMLYNLQGQRVRSNTKGIIIKDCKKVLRK